MPKLKSLNGYEITDEYARNQIADIQDRLSNIGDISGGGNAGTGGGVIIDEDGDLWFGSTEEIEQLSRSAVAGVVYPFAGAVVPDGFLLCDGGEYSRTEYAELFAAIGTAYGSGDGSSTFNVPNLESRTIIGESDNYTLGSVGGEEKHTLTVDEMPRHKHDVPATDTQKSGTAWVIHDVSPYLQDTGVGSTYTGGDQPHNNMQPYIVMQYIISTGKGSGISVDEIVSGINTLPLSVENGGTGATSLAELGRQVAPLLVDEGIASLIGRTAIPEGANLNDYITVGHYYSSGNNVSTTIANTPYTNGGFGLVVRCIYMYNTCNTMLQELTATNGYKYLRRTADSGATWTDWFLVDGRDGVYAEGTSGNWHYWKYANGWAIASFSSDETTLTTDKTSGSFYYAKYGSVSLPFEFIETPQVMADWSASTGSCFTTFVSASTTSAGTFYVNRGTNTETIGRLSILVIGRWK